MQTIQWKKSALKTLSVIAFLGGAFYASAQTPAFSQTPPPPAPPAEVGPDQEDAPPPPPAGAKGPKGDLRPIEGAVKVDPSGRLLGPEAKAERGPRGAHGPKDGPRGPKGGPKRHKGGPGERDLNGPADGPEGPKGPREIGPDGKPGPNGKRGPRPEGGPEDGPRGLKGGPRDHGPEAGPRPHGPRDGQRGPKNGPEDGPRADKGPRGKRGPEDGPPAPPAGGPRNGRPPAPPANGPDGTPPPPPADGPDGTAPAPPVPPADGPDGGPPTPPTNAPRDGAPQGRPKDAPAKEVPTAALQRAYRGAAELDRYGQLQGDVLNLTGQARSYYTRATKSGDDQQTVALARISEQLTQTALHLERAQHGTLPIAQVVGWQRPVTQSAPTTPDEEQPRVFADLARRLVNAARSETSADNSTWKQTARKLATEATADWSAKRFEAARERAHASMTLLDAAEMRESLSTT